MILQDEKWVTDWLTKRFGGTYFCMTKESRENYLKQCATELVNLTNGFVEYVEKQANENDST